MAARKLTEKQRRFVEAFLGPAQGNGTKAAQLVGVARGSAATMAWKWLRKVEVQQALVARVQRKEVVSLHDQTAREALILEIAQDKTISTSDRLRALDMLNRCAGAYTMTHILKGKVGLAQLITRSRKKEQASA